MARTTHLLIAIFVALLTPLAPSRSEAAAGSAPETADAMSRFGWFAELAGACWQGRNADGQTTDTQCYSIQYGTILRGTIEIIAIHGDEAVRFEGDSVFAWNPREQRIDYSFWASDGSYGTGKAYFEGDRIIHVADPGDGSKQAETRTVWRKLDPSAFEVTRERSTAEGWQSVLVVTYHRISG